MVDYTFRIAISLDGSPHSIQPELDENELSAIGLVAVQWAHLEHAILASTYQITEAGGATLPTRAESLATNQRIRAWRSAIEEFISNPDEKARLLRLASIASNLEQDRNKLAHGLWSWDKADPARLTAHSFRPRVAFRKKFDLARLHNLARAIGAVSFEIHFPGGKQEALERFADIVAERGSYVCRSFRLSAREKTPSRSPHRPAKPPKD